MSAHLGARPPQHAITGLAGEPRKAAVLTPRVRPPLPRTALFAVMLLACSPVFVEGRPHASLRQRTIDTERSVLTVHVFRSGIFSFAGDNHEIRAPIASGTIDEGKPAVEFVVQANQMKVLDPDLDAGKRAQVQANMLGPEVLDTQQFPQIRFHSTSVEASGTDTWLVHGELSLHGVTRPIVVRVSEAQQEYHGVASLKQTDFGIKPIRAGAGTVRVKDAVKIEFAIVTRPGV